MPIQYIRNSFMVTCMSLAISHAHGMEAPVDKSTIIVQSNCYKTHKWDIEKHENYTKITYVEIRDWEKKVIKSKTFSEKFSRSIEFSVEFPPAKKRKDRKAPPKRMPLLFVAENKISESKSVYKVYLAKECLDIFARERLTSDPDFREKIEKELEEHEKSSFAYHLGTLYGNTEALDNIIKKYTSSRENKRSIQLFVDNEVKLNRPCSSNWPYKYSYQCPLNSELIAFLFFLYNFNVLPDFMITEIVDFIGIEDFRITSDSMIERLNQRMPEDPTATDFERIAFEEIGKIGNWHRQKELTWTLINELNTPEHYNPTLLIALCKQIDSDKLPFFKEATTLRNRLEAEAHVASPSKMTLEERYIPSIIQLLPSEDTETKRTRTNFANAYFENGGIGNSLHDFSISQKCLMDLLKLGNERGQRIKELELRNKELEAKLKDLEANPSFTNS